MRIKLGALVSAQESFKKLFAEESFTIKFKWQLMKVKKAIDAETQQYEEQRIDLVKKYGIDVGNNQLTVQPDKMQEFMSKIGELLDLDVDLRISKIKLEDLEGVKLTAEDMVHLEPFISE